MGKTFTEINDDLRNFIARQHLFFVATAPLSADGHVNVSPKGLDTFRVLGPTTVAYLDLTGSGVETIAHLRENGRLTIMFCAFEGRPRILRLYGHGRAVEPGDSDWLAVSAAFPDLAGVRAVVVMDVSLIADSCGYAVPLYQYAGDREQLVAWADKKGTEGLTQYRAQKNRASIDGLPGLPSAEES
ncbi:Pyridoxamine 5'-phosphate oxidase [Gemmata sp. SH-PL17]|uniref:pyridoxamine 5'-phosphate oxidase family protein n=1 Tax=Gemmata sp. SH-PL17 TaxID=1630693 RepID=UPI00078D67CF|nr:pyridoxamine 5'-phosphate oxidase family protein [Gemmata sp. SH-PL17]AMV27177.1 Pyridoxamine 5'-phosphate oxidase [Gemmata sp. SH-PL17]